MRSIFLSLFGLLVPWVLIGCAELGVPQQPRLEIAESARIFVVHPQGLFFAPMG